MPFVTVRSQPVFGLPRAPVTPVGPYTDEFNSPSLASKWTKVGALDKYNTSDTPGTLHLYDANIGYAIAGILETVPPFPFTVETKLSAYTLNNNFVSAGIWMFDGTQYLSYGWLYGGYGGSLNDIYWQTWSSLTVRATNNNADIVASAAPIGYRIVATNATTWVFSYFSAGAWTEQSTSAPSFTPKQVGLYIAGQTAGGLADANFDYSRFS